MKIRASGLFCAVSFQINLDDNIFVFLWSLFSDTQKILRYTRKDTPFLKHQIFEFRIWTLKTVSNLKILFLHFHSHLGAILTEPILSFSGFKRFFHILTYYIAEPAYGKLCFNWLFFTIFQDLIFFTRIYGSHWVSEHLKTFQMNFSLSYL